MMLSKSNPFLDWEKYEFSNQVSKKNKQDYNVKTLWFSIAI